MVASGGYRGPPLCRCVHGGNGGPAHISTTPGGFYGMRLAKWLMLQHAFKLDMHEK